MAEPLEMCTEHDAPKGHSSSMTIQLQTALATGVRERPAQVWSRTATSATLGKPFVARLYDPLYYGDDFTDRFSLRDQAVAVEHEVYTRLNDLQRVIIPHFYGVFVAEIPGTPPRHISSLSGYRASMLDAS